MIAHSIIAAKNSGCFDEIIVSTNDTEIAQIAQQYGAKVPFIRPTELSDDFATTGKVIAHALDFLHIKACQDEYACCLYATAPFVQINDLKEGFEKLRETGADFVFSITNFSFPIQRALELTENGDIKMFQPEMFSVRSQDLPEAYHDAGQFYWGTTAAWLAQKPIFNSRTQAVILPRYRVQDIDTLEDWKRAEVMWQVLQDKTFATQI